VKTGFFGADCTKTGDCLPDPTPVRLLGLPVSAGEDAALLSPFIS
jgi:hypothetical protein